MPLPYATKPGDLDRLIADDHALVVRLFEHLEAGRGDRRTLVDQVVFNVALHADAEEKVFYPAMVEAGMAMASDKNLDEHRQVKEQAVVLTRGEPGEPEFEQALRELIAEVRDHALEEEEQLLPQLRHALGEARMAELGEKFTAAKRSSPTHGHPRAPDTPPANVLLGAGAALMDKLRDKASGRQKRLATDASGFLDAQAQRVLDAFGELEPKPIEILEPDQARRQPTFADAVRKVQKDGGLGTAPEPVADVREIAVPGPDGDITVRLYTPDNPTSAALPVLVYIHGGGWVIGDLDVYDASPRALANKAGCIVASVDYRLAPEHPFPAGHEDVLAATAWVMANVDAFGGDRARVAIAGESAGGNMAASTCLQLAASRRATPVFQLLIYPVTTGEQYGESYTDSADARPLNRPMMSWFAHHTFAGSSASPTDPRFELLSLPGEQLAELPSALVITGERDPLRSQGQEFARRLQQAGVLVNELYYQGLPHEFFGMAAVVDKAAQAQEHAATALRQAFGTEAATIGSRSLRPPPTGQ